MDQIDSLGPREGRASEELNALNGKLPRCGVLPELFMGRI